TEYSGIEFDFKMPEGAGCVLQLNVVYYAPATDNHPNSVLGTLKGKTEWWVGFSGAGIYEVLPPEPPDLDGEFRDEQRGFWQKVLDFLQGIWDAIKSIPEFIAELPQKILDGLKSLFVPGEGELEALIEDFKLYAEEKLGFVAQLIGLVPAVIGPMIEAGGGDVVLVLPRVYLSGVYGGIELWGEQGINLTQVIAGNKWLTLFYGMYKVLASALLLGLILRYMYRVMHDILDQKEEE
ncbi:MAG: hypothetical protein FWC27_10075, partial [Firmicutes bacterium]|nr:hypothetical protein [Bacillota bacterium]